MSTAIIVDDEPTTRIDFSGMLAEAGIEVLATAADGFDAVDLCKLHRPDVVIMDLKMPVFDGISAAQHIMQEDLAGSVIVATAYCDAETVHGVIQMGASGYLLKPIDRTTLFVAVQLALENRGRQDALNARIAALERSIADTKLVDRAKAKLATESNTTEADAYRQLQKLAMNKRCTMGELARRLLNQDGKPQPLEQTKQTPMQKHNVSDKRTRHPLQALPPQEGDIPNKAANKKTMLQGKP